MWNEKSIKQFIIGYKFRPAVSKLELTAIAARLDPHEVLLAIITGVLKTSYGIATKRSGVIVLTSERLFIYRRSSSENITYEQLKVSDMLSASFIKGFLFGSIKVNASYGKIIFRQCFNRSARKFVGILQATIKNYHSIGLIPLFADLPICDLVSRYELKQIGIIREGEFTAQFH